MSSVADGGHRWDFRAHHVAISVRDLAASIKFYDMFGFEPVFRMDDFDLSIVHLAGPNGLLIELFRYPQNEDRPISRLGAGNEMEEVGVKHLGLRVDDVVAVRAELVGRGCEHVTEVRHGRAGVDFFFVADPDGLWVEIVQDGRTFPPRAPGGARA